MSDVSRIQTAQTEDDTRAPATDYSDRASDAGSEAAATPRPERSTETGGTQTGGAPVATAPETPPTSQTSQTSETAGTAPASRPDGAPETTGEMPTNGPNGNATGRPAPSTEAAPNSGHAPASPGQSGAAPGDDQSSLVKEAAALRRRWESVQVSFVDDPRQAVSDAEGLVTDVLNDMTAGFRQQRQELESRWSEGHDVSTEQLRRAIQRYREFFERFLRV